MRWTDALTGFFRSAQIKCGCSNKEILYNSAASQIALKKMNEAKDKNGIESGCDDDDDDVVGVDSSTNGPCSWHMLSFHPMAVATAYNSKVKTTYVVSGSESSVSRLLAALLCRPSESSL